MATTMKSRAPLERTEHPHIVKSAGVLGGYPRIEDTRISVLQVMRMFEAGETPQQIVDSFPFLTPAQVHDAISYAYDHPDEMAEHASRWTLRSVLQRGDLVYVDGRLIPRSALRASDIPAGATVYTWETVPELLEP